MGKRKATSANSSNGTAANLGFEAKLWLTADKLRNNMDAAEFKHVVLGLIFLKYISDACEERHQKRIGDIAVYGPESNSTTRRRAMKIEYSEVVTICDLKDTLLTRRTP